VLVYVTGELENNKEVTLVAKTKHFYHIAGKNSVFLAIIIGGYLAKLAFNLLIAKWFSPSIYGDIAVLFKVLEFAIPFALLGSNLAAMRFIPIYILKDENAHLSGFLRWCIKIIVWASLISMTIGTVIATATLTLYKFNYHQIDRYHPLIYLFWLVPIYAFVKLLAALLRSVQKYILSIVPVKLGIFVIEILFLICFALFIPVLNYHYILIAFGLSCLLIMAVQLYAVYLHFPIKVIKEKPVFQSKVWRNTTTAMMFSGIVFNGLMAIDLVFLEIFGVHENEVAYYAAVLIITNAFWLLDNAIKVFFNPQVSYLTQADDKPRLQTLTEHLTFYKLAIIIPTCVLTIYFGKNLLSFFGSSYIHGYPGLVIISIAYALAIPLAHTSSLLLFTGHHQKQLYVNIFILFLLIGLCILLIPKYQLIGAAWSLAISQVAMYLIQLFLANRYTGIKTIQIY